MMFGSSRFIVVSVVVFSVLTAFVVLGSANPSKAAASQATMVATAPAGQVTTVKCQPVQVSVSDKRVHVKCQEGVGDIVYFAAPTDNMGTAGNYLTVMLDALSGKKQLLVDVLMDDLSGEAYGCLNSNCRPIQGISIES